MEKIGLIAGIGTLPIEFVKALKEKGYKVVVIAVVENFDLELRTLADKFYCINVFKLDKIIKTFVNEGINEVTMVGKVTKEFLFQGYPIPDLRTIKFLTKLKNRKDDTILLAIVEEFAKNDIKVIDQTKFLKHLILNEAVFSKRKPTTKELKDISFGFKIAKKIAGMDIGQTVVVAEQAVMAIEAIEGTDVCIIRGGNLAKKNAVVVKVAKPEQDLRFDVPTIGLKTIQSMVTSGCNVVAIEAESTFFVEKEAVLELANKNDIVVCAIKEENLVESGDKA